MPVRHCGKACPQVGPHASVDGPAVRAGAFRHRLHLSGGPGLRHPMGAVAEDPAAGNLVMPGNPSLGAGRMNGYET